MSEKATVTSHDGTAVTAGVSFPDSVAEEGRAPGVVSRARPARDRASLSATEKAWDIDGDGELDEAELALKQLDKTKKGTLSKEQMYTLMQQNITIRDELSKMKKFIIGLIGFTCLLALANVGMSFAAAFLAKDTKTQDGKIVAKSANADDQNNALATNTAADNYIVDREDDAAFSTRRRLCEVNRVGWRQRETDCGTLPGFTVSDAVGSAIGRGCKRGHHVTLTFPLLLDDGSADTVDAMVCPHTNAMGTGSFHGVPKGSEGMTLHYFSGQPSVDVQAHDTEDGKMLIQGISSPAGGQCDLNFPCGADLECVGNVCLLGGTAGTSCDASSPCDDGLLCEAAKCVKALTDDGDGEVHIDECQYNTDCPNVGDYCMNPCDDPSSAGKTCKTLDELNTQCVDSLMHGECPICAVRVESAMSSGSCQVQDSCQSDPSPGDGVGDGVGDGDGHIDECQDNDGCGEGEYCMNPCDAPDAGGKMCKTLDALHLECVNSGMYGSCPTCTVNEDINPSGYCVDQRTCPGTAGSTCDDANPCDKGLRCEGSTCATVPADACTTNSDCARDEYCVEHCATPDVRGRECRTVEAMHLECVDESQTYGACPVCRFSEDPIPATPSVSCQVQDTCPGASEGSACSEANPCGVGLWCEGSTCSTYLADLADPAPKHGASCTDTADCEDGTLRCDKGTCKGINGHPCTVGSESCSVGNECGSVAAGLVPPSDGQPGVCQCVMGAGGCDANFVCHDDCSNPDGLLNACRTQAELDAHCVDVYGDTSQCGVGDDGTVAGCQCEDDSGKLEDCRDIGIQDQFD